MENGKVITLVIMVALAFFFIISKSNLSEFSKGESSMHLQKVSYLHKPLSEDRLETFKSEDKAASKGKATSKLVKQLNNELGGSSIIKDMQPSVKEGIDPTTEWYFPLDGEPYLTSKMGPRSINNGGSNVHDGIDLAYSNPGEADKIYAVRDGKVITAGVELTASGSGSGRGYYMEIEHDINGIKYYSSYSHMKKPHSHSVGDTVKMGEEINYVGATAGVKLKPHLHLEMGVEDKKDVLGNRPNADKLLPQQLLSSAKGRWWYKSSKEWSRLDPQEFFEELRGKGVKTKIKRIEKVPTDAPIKDVDTGNPN